MYTNINQDAMYSATMKEKGTVDAQKKYSIDNLPSDADP
jgi:hypothetical protein